MHSYIEICNRNQNINLISKVKHLKLGSNENYCYKG